MILYLLNRPPDTNFKAPTFDNWSVWPFEYNQRLTTLCNQIVFTAEINSQLIIKNKEECIRSSDIDALIEVRYILFLIYYYMSFITYLTSLYSYQWLHLILCLTDY